MLYGEPACPVCRGLAAPRKCRRKDLPFWRRPSFVAEQAKWYAKLAKAGFADLEYQHPLTGEPREYMRRGSLHDLARVYRWDRARYFELAQQYASTLPGGKRDPRGHHRVWRRYARGLAPTLIAERLGWSMHRAHYAVETMTKRFLRWASSRGEA